MLQIYYNKEYFYYFPLSNSNTIIQINLMEFFIMFILRNSTVLPFSLNTYITFQSCRTMLLLKTSKGFFQRLSVFAILSIIILIF